MFQRFSFRSAVVGLAALVGLCACGSPPEEPRWAEGDKPERVLSLSPGITEVIFEIGAGNLLVGRTQFTTYPKEAVQLPSVGPGLTPDYEALVRLAPDLIVSAQVQSLNAEEIRSLAPVEVYPWLSFEEIVGSIQRLGQTLGQPESAALVAERMQAVLDTPRDPDAPTLLLVLGQPTESAPTLWFSREASLHGTVLEAAGFRNAMAEGLHETPTLPIEALLSVDPDFVIVLIAEDKLSAEARAQHQAFWSRFTTLQAVQNERVYFLNGSSYFSTGPRILSLLPALQEILRLVAEEVQDDRHLGFPKREHRHDFN